MKKRISVSTVGVLILLSMLLTFQITFDFVERQYEGKIPEQVHAPSRFTKLEELDELIRQHYCGDFDGNHAEIGGLSGYLSSLGDPYAKYMTAKEYKDYLSLSERVSVGIGCRYTYNAQSGETVLFQVFPGSPAEIGGFLPGDILYRIDGQSVSEMGFYQAVDALSGEIGTTVSVTVKRKIGAQLREMELSAVRDVVSEPSVSLEMLSDGILYVRFFEFCDTTFREFNEVFSLLPVGEVRAAIFDVRNCFGESIESLHGILDLFLPNELYFRIQKSDGSLTEYSGTSGELSVPFSVLINAETKGVPELFAAVLSEVGKAELIGDTTYGKGTLQTAFEMSDGAVVLLSDRLMILPSGSVFHRSGLTPFLKCTLIPENLYLATKEEDNQFQTALTSVLNHISKQQSAVS